MADASRRAAAKPARGGLDNAMFLQAALETLPPDLDAIADRVTVNYPWGSLLRAVVLPEPLLLRKLAALAKPDATLEALINMTPLADPVQAAKLGLVDTALLNDHAAFRAAYVEAGFAIGRIGPLSGPPLSTRWGKQLAYAGRAILRITARRGSSAPSSGRSAD